MGKSVELQATPRTLEYAITANLMYCDYSPHQKHVIEHLMLWCKILTAENAALKAELETLKKERM